MICSNCGTENESGRKFCKECAARLAVVCPSCGAANGADSKFCGECAAPLVGGADSTASSSPLPNHRTADRSPVAERRLVSVLFADLVGFTTLAEESDAEDTRELLSRYFHLSRDVIGRHGGIVEKFIGDAVMAVWGAPIANEYDAELAVRAGLELVDAVKTLGPGIAARAGIMTGEAAVTIGAKDQGMVAGDLVNTASRLQSVADPGTVIVGEATQRAASRAIAFELAGERSLKGKAAPVSAWRALRVVAERGGRNRSEALEAPFVGRDDELRLLKDLHHATGREQRARLVSVAGPAGIGKSRLAWEFLKYLDGLAESVWWHDGRCPAYGDGISFWALGEMIRARAGLVEGDDEETTRTRVAEMLAVHVPDEAERRWIEVSLLALLGFGSGTAPSEQLFGAWRTFFERLAASAPVVLVFEDFHYADSGLLDFVDDLIDWARSSPIYVLTLARPELLERRPGWGAGKRNFASLHLEPLPEPAMRSLLLGLVPGLPAHAVQAIVARAEGIPLYAVETVRMLLAEGRLEQQDGAYAPADDLTELAVPETLTALIASRLDGLDPSERALVSDASVLGKSFTTAALAAVSGVTETGLRPLLDGLVRREILSLAVDARSPERGQYAFVQALIREVAYNTLARPQRKARHLAAARFLEALGSDELAGALAGHYLAAQANAPAGPERDAIAGQARIALQAAADRAAALGSHDQALIFLEQALSITSEPAAQAAVLSATGASAKWAGRYELAEASYRRATDLFRLVGDRPASAATIAALAEALLSGRRTADALALVEPAIVEFSDLGADPGVVALQGQQARAYFLNGDHRRAIETSEPVLEAAEHADLRDILADALVTKGSALGSLGRLQEGVGVIEIAERIARANGLSGTLLRALRNRSAIQGFDVAADATRSLAEEVLELSRRVGDLGTRADALQTLGWCWALFDTDPDRAMATWSDLLAEDMDAADEIPILDAMLILRSWLGDSTATSLARLEDLATQVSEPGFRSMPLELRGWIAFADGRLADARREWEARLEIVPDGATFLLPWAGRAALWEGDLEAVRRYLGRLEATGVHLPAVELRSESLRAGLVALSGGSVDAVARYRSVLDGWRQLGQTWEEAFTGLDMAAVLDPTDPAVRVATDRAREILERLRATPFLERLDASLARSPAVRLGA